MFSTNRPVGRPISAECGRRARRRRLAAGGLATFAAFATSAAFGAFAASITFAVVATPASAVAEPSTTRADTVHGDTVQTSTSRPDTAAGADTTRHPASPAQKPAAKGLAFSGVIFGNFQLHTDSLTRANNGGKSTDRFDIERVYLNFIMPVGRHASIRATTDIFQNATAGYYGGWDVRLKYAWLQYDVLRGKSPDAASALVRVGMLTTVLIDYEESFWPRWLSPTGPDRNSFFPSSDVGAAGLLTLPSRWGQLYATVTNGNGYQSPETDRFKDYALRLSLTPFGKTSGLFKTFSISPWVYAGTKGSEFSKGGTGEVGPVTSGLARNRWGVFAAVKDRRLTAGAEYAQRVDESESGANTLAAPRVVTRTTGELYDGWAVVRPAEWVNPGRKSPFGAFARWDHFRPDNAGPGWNQFLIGGLFWEPTPKTAFSVDYQQQSPKSGSTTPESKTWFIHWVATF